MARSTLVIGVDVSGSFRHDYDDAIDFAAHYLYGHLNGLGELSIPSAVFVGSVGGEEPGETKSFQPMHAFEGKSVPGIAEHLRQLFPAEDSFTDFNAFFDRVATLVKRQGLTLAPLNIVVLSDGVPDAAGSARGAENRFAEIDLDPLEYLSRSVTVRLLYASPTISVDWERRIERSRVRMWTVDAPVMRGWREQLSAGEDIDVQERLWRWMLDNVDFRVRSRRL
ncbi:MAG: hypothetical protein GTN62_11475 [Gemmatimonadales bacterium]|nr:hypothetical protein [Gemmatimonadales bacterium]NIN50715.1 hypothetical protein [Gemmatimonadales bacterium]NIP08179.1 hypothetical protein [Gemmatimonadales bacterium]NIR01057.1 hypothetical protein [Gemmatimonadales bacterium]NIS65136.1 hypothetical protein [Gemmatimonadales bacterium]